MENAYADGKWSQFGRVNALIIHHEMVVDCGRGTHWAAGTFHFEPSEDDGTKIVSH